MTPRTPFIETEALLRAMDGLDDDKDAEDALVDYLATNFLPNELGRLARACEHLRWACREARPVIAERS